VLRNAILDQLNQRDLGAVSALVANWDTLGWIYFAKGDYPKAEKYIAAAWNVDQHSEVGDHLGQIYEKLGRKEDAIRTYALALAAVRPTPEGRTHLAALVGGDSKVDAIVDKYRGNLQDTQRITLKKVAKDSGRAEFFVMLTPGKSGASVEGIKFVSGDEKLKIFSEALKAASYSLNFPDDTPTKILRRGVLTCSKESGDCVFVMILPGDVRSID
jgi:tetratricopeptide (TPR) repeat protein